MCMLWRGRRDELDDIGIGVFAHWERLTKAFSVIPYILIFIPLDNIGIQVPGSAFTDIIFGITGILSCRYYECINFQIKMTAIFSATSCWKTASLILEAQYCIDQRASMLIP